MTMPAGPGSATSPSNNPPPGFFPPGPPYTVPDVTLVGGSLRARWSALEALCRALFGSTSSARVLSNEIFFDLGHVPPNPARRIAQPWSFLVARMLVEQDGDVRGVVTHAFVDRDVAAVVGREVFGFPAIPARFETSPGMAGSLVDVLRGGGSLSVLVEVLPDVPGNATVEPIFTVTLGAGGPSQGGSPDHWVWNELEPDQPNQGGAIRFVQLKQMRDAIDPERACLQTLVRGGLRSSHPAQKLDVPLTFSVSNFLPFQLATTLGLAANRVLDPQARRYGAERVSLTFDLERTRQIAVTQSGRGGAPFRFRSGDPQFAPTYEFTDVSLTGFRLPVSPTRLRELVDRELNPPGRRYRYEPASSEVVLECLHYTSMRAANPPRGVRLGDNEQQRELLIRVLVGRVDLGSRVAERPAMYCPFLFVDSRWSVISGREVIGYPKRLATFRGYERNGVLDVCRIDAQTNTGELAHAVTLDCGIDTPKHVLATLGQLNGVHEVPDDFGLTDREWSATRTVQDVARGMWWNVDDLIGLQSFQSFVRPWATGAAFGYGVVQAKRFPDASGTTYNYDELLEGDYTIRNVSVALPLHRATVDFGPEDPFQLQQQLGIGERLIVPAGGWYQANCDFRVRILDPLG